MSEGRWRDARRSKASRQKMWEQVYNIKEDDDDDKEENRKK